MKNSRDNDVVVLLLLLLSTLFLLLFFEYVDVMTSAEVLLYRTPCSASWFHSEIGMTLKKDVRFTVDITTPRNARTALRRTRKKTA